MITFGNMEEVFIIEFQMKQRNRYTENKLKQYFMNSLKCY